MREAGSRATRRRLQALQQRSGTADLRQRVAAGVDVLGGVLEEDRQRVPAGPHLAAGTEAAARAGRTVLLRRRRAKSPGIRPAQGVTAAGAGATNPVK